MHPHRHGVAPERLDRMLQLDAPAIDAASGLAIKGLHPTTDIHGSSEYRLGLLQVMTERALSQATQVARYVQ